MEELKTTTFSINDFKAALAKKGITQKELAKLLGVAETTITKRTRDGNFTATEIREMISLFGKEQTMNFMFCEGNK